jgi:hypothetical protein
MRCALVVWLLLAVCCILVLAPSSPASAAAGKLARLAPAATETPLLGGRLSVRMPPGARVEARRRSIMAAPESGHEETRVVLEAGEEKLVLMSYELFMLAGPSLEKNIRQDLLSSRAAAPMRVEAIKAGAGVEAFAVVPSKLATGTEAVLVLGLYVRSPDRTVQLLNFYVNPAAAKDGAGCASLARKIGATVAAGKRTLRQQAGTRQLPAPGGKGLTVTVPAGYVATMQAGPDFVVHRLRKLIVLGTPYSSIGIYLGGHPSYQYRQRGIVPGSVKQEPGKLLGQKVSWSQWSMPGKGGPAATTAEVIAPLGVTNTMLHVFCTAESAAQLKELKAIASTLAK